MPLFAVICRDKPGHLHTRLDTRDQHLTFLKDQPALKMAGPLIEEGEMRGSLLVVELADLAAAQDWAAGDPYKAAGLFQSTEIIEWKKVIG